MSDINDEDLDEETKDARVNYRKLAQQWVDDEEARTAKLAGSIVEAIKDYSEKLGKAVENEASEVKKTALKLMHGKLIEGHTVWEMRHEKLKDVGGDAPEGI